MSQIDAAGKMSLFLNTFPFNYCINLKYGWLHSLVWIRKMKKIKFNIFLIYVVFELIKLKRLTSGYLGEKVNLIEALSLFTTHYET